jgi:hypothetical protein
MRAREKVWQERAAYVVWRDLVSGAVVVRGVWCSRCGRPVGSCAVRVGLRDGDLFVDAAANGEVGRSIGLS